MKPFFLALVILSSYIGTAQDSTERTKPQLKVSLNYNSGLNFFGRTDSLKSTGVFPMAEFWASPNFYINAAPIFVNNAVQKMEYAGTIATIGYQYMNEHWLTNVNVVKPFYKGDAKLVQSALKAQGNLSVSHLNKVANLTLGGDIATSIINRRVPAAAPLFLWVSQYAPHVGAPTEADDPAIATPAVPHRWKNFYASTPLPKDPNFNEADVSDKPAYVRNKRLVSATMQAQLKESNAQRWESLRAVDESVADIMNALQASGELANSVIVFTSDNGWMMGEHRIHAGKTVPYEESSRVPLVIRGPGFAANTSRPQPVANIDLAPTFADLADTTPGLAVDGRSLLPLATEPAAWPARTLVLEAGPKTIGGPDSYHGIRTPRYKYVRHSTGEVEFYDLIADPHELTSLTNVPAHDSTQAQLESLLSKMENCAGATCR
jgi:hypothetical protein